jgi:hypothetical protein
VGFLVAGGRVSGIRGGQERVQWDSWWLESGSVGFLLAGNGVGGISGGQKQVSRSSGAQNWGQWDFW